MILHVNNSHTVNSSDNILTNAAFLRKYDLQERNIFTWDHDYSDAPNFATLTDYKAAAISYIASYVAKMTSKQLLCIQCCMALGSQNHPSNSKFVEFKDRGGLFTPTLSVIKICEETEQCFNRMLVTTGGSLPHSPDILDAIATAVLGSVNLSSIFMELDGLMMDSSVDENHIYILIKMIAKSYCKIRLHHLAKET